MDIHYARLSSFVPKRKMRRLSEMRIGMTWFLQDYPPPYAHGAHAYIEYRIDDDIYRVYNPQRFNVMYKATCEMIVRWHEFAGDNAPRDFRLVQLGGTE